MEERGWEDGKYLIDGFPRTAARVSFPFFEGFRKNFGGILQEFRQSARMERYRWSEGECSGALFYSFASLLDLLYFILRSWSRLVVSCLVLHSLHLSSFALEILPKWYILSHIIPMCGIQLCLVHLVLATGGFEVLHLLRLFRSCDGGVERGLNRFFSAPTALR